MFREDLKFHPKNPWGLVGLIACLNGRLNAGQGKGNSCCSKKKVDQAIIPAQDRKKILVEVQQLSDMLAEQRQSKWADYDVAAPCACCLNGTE